MATPFKLLINDYQRYVRAFQLYLERSSEHQCMQDFIRGILPDILASIGDGKVNLNVMGIGSGAGEMDLEMLAQLHMKHPGIRVDNEVVEPSSEMLHKYKALVSETSNLNYVNFTWHKMTASEFEEHWKEKNIMEKMDFIHMIEMLYYVKDPEATVSFYRSLLNKNGKLVIILVSEESGWARLGRAYRSKLCKAEISQCVTTGDIKSFLDAKGIPYKYYELNSQMDITECFTEGCEEGELLLDFLTEVIHFSKTAPPDLKAGVLDLLRHPDCSKEVDGRISFNSNLGVLVLDP
ncbi:histamine N-methyltransferase-like [Chanos chanos]|uniref:Histamine N-methyltransferase-like n=1 Tax=Chanos chanos TaxID=29144 RepID=A0A6J2WCC9_CHACN|nr:histamine N-methyltransferase-like [Chanos chanos]